jgi:hypothetical protein
MASQVWNNFELEEVQQLDGETMLMAICKRCRIYLSADRRYGTGHLVRHVKMHTKKDATN